MPAEQRHILFSGTVQGVGFRYTARQVASRHPVTGHVRNLPDGRVECVVEGKPDDIDDFVADLSGAMQGYIRDRDEESHPATGSYERFEVRH